MILVLHIQAKFELFHTDKGHRFTLKTVLLFLPQVWGFSAGFTLNFHYPPRIQRWKSWSVHHLVWYFDQPDEPRMALLWSALPLQQYYSQICKQAALLLEATWQPANVTLWMAILICELDEYNSDLGMLIDAAECMVLSIFDLHFLITDVCHWQIPMDRHGRLHLQHSFATEYACIKQNSNQTIQQSPQALAIEQQHSHIPAVKNAHKIALQSKWVWCLMPRTAWRC